PLEPTSCSLPVSRSTRYRSPCSVQRSRRSLRVANRARVLGYLPLPTTLLSKEVTMVSQPSSSSIGRLTRSTPSVSRVTSAPRASRPLPTSVTTACVTLLQPLRGLAKRSFSRPSCDLSPAFRSIRDVGFPFRLAP